MDITTRYEIKERKVTNEWAGGSNLDDGKAQLIIYVSINGKETHNFVAMSGPKADIEAFVNGEIDSAEVERRWFRGSARTTPPIVLEDPTVKVGQVWESCDKRDRARKVQVAGFKDKNGAKYAVCNQGWLHPQGAFQANGRQVTIRLDRFRPTSSGWKLVRE